MSGVFVDTAGLFAALVRNDTLHRRAAPTLERLLGTRIDLFSNSYVLLEMMALLQARVGFGAARRLEQDLRPLLQVVWIDEGLHERAFSRLQRRAESGLSLVDCSSFVVMEEMGLRHVFTYDDDFADEGFICVTEPEEVERSLVENRDVDGR